MNAMRTIMKAVGWYVVLIAILMPEPLLAQVAPYSLSPKWMVGRNSGMSFPGPANMTGNPAANGGQEATSTLCFPDKSIFLYCNDAQIYSGANGLITAVNGAGGQSSTQGAVTLPDPANANQAYVFTGNDLTGGNAGGINYYVIQKSGATYSIVSGPTALAATGAVNEGLVACADGNGGYWVVSHNRVFSPTPHQYLSWHVTASGVGGLVTSPSVCRGGSGAGGTIKISKCQTKIALIGSQEIEVYNWDKSTGMTNGLIATSGIGNGPGSGYSGEFSPNGNVLYFSGLNSNLLQWDLTQTYAAGVVTITGANNIAGMSLGPDDKIYIARSSTAVAAINTPNTLGDACGYTASALTVTGLGPFIGLANTTWLNPNKPVITKSIACLTVDFDFDFQTYFLDDIGVTTASIDWDFGEGAGWQTGLGHTPTHVYGANGTYTVKLRFNDSFCTQQWTATTTVTVSCAAAPVSLVSFTGADQDGQTYLTWTTVSEVNNDYFEVERSEDGINFYSVGKVKGKGTLTTTSEYHLADGKGLTGVTYYRLLQSDLDGTKTYSNIIQVESESSSLTVSPNPFTDNFTVTFSGNKSSQIKILDLLGRVVETKAMEQESYSVAMGENLTKGTYIVSVVTDQESYNYKLVKE